MSEEPKPNEVPKGIGGPVGSSIGVFAGIFAGGYALASGAHGGEAWPTAVLTGPVYLIAQAFGDNLGYVFVLWIGTALIYGMYGLFAGTRLRMLIIALVVHAMSSALTLLRA